MEHAELDLAFTFIQTHPYAAARELELQPVEDVIKLIDTLSATQAQRIITHMLPPYAGRLCSLLPAETAAELLVNASLSQVTAILRCVPELAREQLLGEIPDKTATLCRLLLNYSEDTVGAWMMADILILPAKSSASSALQRLALAYGVSDSDSLPVVDHEKQLVGLVDVRKLLRAKGATLVTQLMQESPPALLSRTSLASALDHPGWQFHDTLAVLNRSRQLVGLLRHVELRRGLERFEQMPTHRRQDNLLGDFSGLYLRSLNALFGLASGNALRREKSGEVL